ncbi:hypothetical protein P3S67_023566 [Capsicum chacoense]
MPSGAKKRKAAKKKKQVQEIQPPSRSHGEEVLKRDDKESDSEGSSPASQDYQNRENQFAEGEVENVEKQLDDSRDRSIDENQSNGVKHHEGKEVEIVGNEDGGRVQVERELKVEGESESQKINVEFVEPVVESYRGGLRRSFSSGSSSSRSSSEEKHDVTDKNNIVVDDAPTAELVKDIESLLDKTSIVVDDASAVEFVKDNKSLPDKNSIVIDDAPAAELVKDIESLPDKNSIVVDDVPVVEFVKDNKSLPDKNSIVVDDAPAVELVKDIESLAPKSSVVVDDAPAVKDNESLPHKSSVVVDDAPPVELVKDSESAPDTQVADSLVGTTSTSDLDKTAISENIVQVTTSASAADNVSTSTVESVVKEKGEENLCVVDEKGAASDTVVDNCEENFGAIVDKATISEVLMETGSEKRNEAVSAASSDVSAISNGNSLENTDAKASATLENEEKIEVPHSAPKIDASVCADNVKESPARECHDRQVTALPSRPVQTTSWKNCCGLFELFAGSNR